MVENETERRFAAWWSSIVRPRNRPSWIYPTMPDPRDYPSFGYRLSLPQLEILREHLQTLQAKADDTDPEAPTEVQALKMLTLRLTAQMLDMLPAQD